MKKFFPDIEELSQKDSTLSTKRYADLRLVNHFIYLSWASFVALVAFKQWDLLTWHLAIIGAFATGRGVMALEKFSSKFSFKNETKTN